MTSYNDDSKSKFYGKLPTGDAVYSYKLKNKNGIEVKIINYGATITSLKIPLKTGKIIDVVLGLDALEDYIKSYEIGGSPYYGATVGRYSGRIKQGLFSLNNKVYQLEKNLNNHSLHGGNIGFSQRIWEVKKFTYGINPSITLTYFSPNNEGGYPGDLELELTYTLSENNELSINYIATTSEDTIINLTNHSYFNLDGHTETISNQDLYINSKTILETDNENVPSGLLLKVDSTSYDFSNAKKCPEKIDTSFVLNKKNKIAASLYSEINNLKMIVFTDQPSVHIYVGGKNDDLLMGKENIKYKSNSGICFETQNFPDAPNHNHFPNSVLKKNETYLQKTVYKFEI
ncbi:MAG: galactose mutarotase [Flavobacteriaceae bacterium]|nr:galactose mutarotase [Flavobacteriaceae bacterium]